MTKEITITFDIQEHQYDLCQEYISEFENKLYSIGVTGVSVLEDVEDNFNEDGVLIDKTSSVEIDSEIFYNNISDVQTSWSFDKDDIEDYPEVVQYLEEYEPNELKALRNGDIKYLEVYRDTF